MKKIICVTSKSVAERLADEGFNYIVQSIGNNEVYAFVETDRLFKLINDKSRFSKKEWFYHNKLNFDI